MNYEHRYAEAARLYGVLAMVLAVVHTSDEMRSRFETAIRVVLDDAQADMIIDKAGQTLDDDDRVVNQVL